MSHVIHRIRVELQTPSRDVATAAQDEVSRAIQDELPAALEPLLNARFPRGIQRRIDRLEVNLGHLPRRRFREAFLRALIDQIKQHCIPSWEQTTRPFAISKERPEAIRLAEGDGAIAAFLHYFATGSLPWWFSISRWREEIPWALTDDGSALALLRNQLRTLLAAAPDRILRLLPFPQLFQPLLTDGDSAPAWNEDLAKAISAMPQRLAQRVLLSLSCMSGAGVVLDLQTARAAVRHLLDGEKSGHLDVVRQLIDAAQSPYVSETAIAPLPARVRNHGTRSSEIEKGRDGDRDVDREGEEGLPTQSAGLVLLHPFFLRFFQRFEWLDEHQHLRTDRRWQAVHALHFLAHATFPRDEVELVLEKTLCGINVAEPADWPEMTDAVLGEADALLRAVIGHWRALKDTSPEGLREGFLNRPGLLYLGGKLTLQVEARAQDVLLSRLPWSYEQIALPWISPPIRVRWPAPF